LEFLVKDNILIIPKPLIIIFTPFFIFSIMNHPHSNFQRRLSSTTKIFRLSIYLGLLCSLLSLPGCNAIRSIPLPTGGVIDDVLNKTNAVIFLIDRTINQLGGEVTNFNQIMDDAVDQIRLLDDVVANQIKNAQDAANNFVASSSAEIRCSFAFTIDFLVQKLENIKTSLKGEEAPALEPKICTATPEIVDMNRPPNDRNNVSISGYFFKDSPEKLVLYRVNQGGSMVNYTSKLSISSDYKVIINLGQNGIPLSSDTEKLQLTWNGMIISEIPVIQAIPEPCFQKQRTITNISSVKMTPQYGPNFFNGKEGNRNFRGKGPCTFIRVKLFTSNGGRALYANIFVRMYECPDKMEFTQWDYTYGEQTKIVKLADADPGFRIKSISTSSWATIENVDKEKNRTELISGEGPVRTVLIQGDVSGNDLTGPSYVDINFNNISVVYEEIGNCVPN